MENNLIYWKSAVEDLRGTKEPELLKALVFARKRVAEIEAVLFMENSHEAITDRLLERVLDALKRLPGSKGTS